jgi:hypothetical protein
LKRYVDKDDQIRYDLAESDFWFLLTALARHSFEAGRDLPKLINDRNELWASFWGMFPPLLDQIDPQLFDNYIADYPPAVEANTHATV